jgi:hypothetical protein
LIDPGDRGRLLRQHGHSSSAARPAEDNEGERPTRGFNGDRLLEEDLREMTLQPRTRGGWQPLQPIEEQLELFPDVCLFGIVALVAGGDRLLGHEWRRSTTPSS